jgi:hypothetical protein
MSAFRRNRYAALLNRAGVQPVFWINGGNRAKRGRRPFTKKLVVAMTEQCKLNGGERCALGQWDGEH